ncbi:MAG: trigger factor [Chitinispirillales bacterium]|jgi:trigger factor|nr:trigger factor [Chitinispirillales bacterium]
MNTKVESVGEWKKSILIEISKEEVQKEFNKALNDVKKNIDIQGFRKGKVPEKIIISRYGESLIMQAAEKLFSESFYKACEDNKINPAGDPVFDNTNVNIKEISDISFKATVEIDPEIKIENYKKLGVKVNEVKVNDGEVDAVIESVKSQRAELNETKEPVKKGDIVSLKYENVMIDGEKTDKLPAPLNIEVGNAPLAELNTELTGLKAGDKKDISFVFSENYPIADYSNKPGSASVEIVQVRAKTLLPLDEEFFAQIGVAAKNEEELKVIIKDNLLNKKKNEEKEAACERAIDKLLSANKFFVPDGRVKYYIENLRKNESPYYDAKNPQPSLEEYLETRKDEAIKNIRRYRILDYIVREEKIKVGSQEVDAYIENIAKTYNYPFDKFKESLRKSGETLHIREELKITKTLDCLIGETKWEDAASDA